MMLKALPLLLTLLPLAFNISSLRAEWRIEVFAGKFFPLRSDLHLQGPGPGDRVSYRSVEWEDESFDSPVYYGWRVGRYGDVSDRVGFELEFIHAKIVSNPEQQVRAEGVLDGAPLDETFRLGDRLQSFNLSHGLNFMLANVAWRPLRRGAPDDSPAESFHAVMRLGAGWTLPHTESEFEGRRREQYEFGGPGLQASIAGVLPFNRRYAVNVEYKYTHAWLSGLGLAGGTVEMETGGSHLIFGPALSF